MRYLPEREHRSLIAFVERNLADHPCDHTLRFTMQWAVEHGGTDIDTERLKESLALMGGYCDCEVILNTDPEDWE